jgi:hypothetical protein
MKPSDIVSIATGFAVGDGVSDIVENPIEKLATGFVAGSISAKVTKTVLDETGIGDLIDDVFDIF